MVRIPTELNRMGKTVRIAPKNLYNVSWWRNQNHITTHVVAADTNAKAVAAAIKRWRPVKKRAPLGDNVCVLIDRPRAHLIVSGGRSIPTGVRVDLIAR